MFVKNPETSTSRVRNARGDGERLRDEIVAAATTLLQSSDAESVTLRAIARVAGITAPSIYRHFDNVDSILRAVIEVTFADLETTLRAAGSNRSGEQQVWEVSRAYLGFARDHPGQYRLLFGGAWNAATVDPEDLREREERGQIGQEAFRVLVEAIAAAAHDGASISTDPAADATALWVGLHGLASLRRTTPLFPWPTSVESTIIRSLARMTDH